VESGRGLGNGLQVVRVKCLDGFRVSILDGGTGWIVVRVVRHVAVCVRGADVLGSSFRSGLGPFGWMRAGTHSSHVQIGFLQYTHVQDPSGFRSSLFLSSLILSQSRSICFLRMTPGLSDRRRDLLTSWRTARRSSSRSRPDALWIPRFPAASTNEPSGSPLKCGDVWNNAPRRNGHDSPAASCRALKANWIVRLTASSRGIA
jgi:hypothetical protein